MKIMYNSAKNMAVLQETLGVSQRTERPTQLRLGWERLDRGIARKIERSERNVARVREFVDNWMAPHPGQRLTVKTIARELRMNEDDVSSRLDKLRNDPTFKDPRRKSLPVSESTIQTVTKGLAYLHPEVYASLTTALIEAGIHKKAGRVVPFIEDKFPVRVLTGMSRGKASPRFIILREHVPQIADFLSQAFLVPSTSPRRTT